MAKIGLMVIVTAVAWFVLGAVLGVVGVVMTSHIPFAGLGMFLAVLGAVIHSALLVLNLRPKWWKVGVALAFILSTFSIVGGMLADNRFPLVFMLFFFVYYFTFGSLLYVFIQKCIVIPLLKQ